MQGAGLFSGACCPKGGGGVAHVLKRESKLLYPQIIRRTGESLLASHAKGTRAAHYSHNPHLFIYYFPRHGGSCHRHDSNDSRYVLPGFFGDPRTSSKAGHGVQSAEETALEQPRAAQVQEETDLQRSRLYHPSAAAHGRGQTQRARKKPRQAGKHGLPDAAPACAQRSGQQEDEQSGDAALGGGVHPSASAAAGRAHAVSAVLQCGVPSPSVSNMYYSAGSESPHSAYSSDEGSYEHLSSEEQELLDFTTWFDRYESGRWQFLSVFHFYRPRDPQLSAPLFKKAFFISNTLLHEQHYTQRVQNTLFFVWMDRITVIFVYTGDSLLFYSITGASLSTKDWC